MPRRELYGVSGLVTTVSMAVIESLADEHWYAEADSVADDHDAKEVRLGLLIQRADQYLISEAGGILLHTTSVPPDASELGPGLAALKNLARVCARGVLSQDPTGVQMLGYLNDDGLVEVRPYLVVVYRVTVASDVPATEGYAWVGGLHLVDIPLDPVSSLVAGAIGD